MAETESCAIPAEVALRLCEEIRQVNGGKWYTFNGLWCWGCARFSPSPEKRCFAATPENRGCSQVNRRYDATAREIAG